MNIIEEFFPLHLRLSFGITFFIVMGLLDYKKNPANPKRAKEYCFIFSLAIIAAAFGVIHDSITFKISHEYFEVAKDLGRGASFFPDVVLLALKASYWVGLLVGLAFVIANNPKEGLPQLGYRALYRKVMWVFLIALVFATAAAILSFFLPPYFSIGGEKILKNVQNFETVAYVHWGTYIGAVIGAIHGIWNVRKDRSLSLQVKTPSIL